MSASRRAQLVPVAFFVLSRCFLDFSVGVRASVIGLSQISSFFLLKYRISVWKHFPQKPRKCCLPETRAFLIM